MSRMHELCILILSCMRELCILISRRIQYIIQWHWIAMYPHEVWPLRDHCIVSGVSYDDCSVCNVRRRAESLGGWKMRHEVVPILRRPILNSTRMVDFTCLCSGQSLVVWDWGYWIDDGSNPRAVNLGLNMFGVVFFGPVLVMFQDLLDQWEESIGLVLVFWKHMNHHRLIGVESHFVSLNWEKTAHNPQSRSCSSLAAGTAWWMTLARWGLEGVLQVPIEFGVKHGKLKNHEKSWVA